MRLIDADKLIVDLETDMKLRPLWLQNLYRFFISKIKTFPTAHDIENK
jgi:hypothetical protein